MEENNQKLPPDNMPQRRLHSLLNNDSKLIVLMFSVFVAVMFVGFLVYRGYVAQHQNASENLPDAVAPIVWETVSREGSVLYRNADAAISFQYPKELFLLDKDRDGYTMAPQLSFRPHSYPEDFSRDVCITDCIQFSFEFEVDREIVWPPHESALQGSNAGFSPEGSHIYKDETGSKPFQINGAEAIRYYYVSRSDGDYYQIQPNQAPIPGAQLKGYALREVVFIKDPHFNKRIVQVTYYEPDKHNLPLIRSSDGGIFLTEFLNGAKIRQLFNQTQHLAFQDVLASLDILPINWDAFAAHSSNEFNISFQAPKYWGAFINEEDRTYPLFFRGPVWWYNFEPPISFEVTPPTERDCCGEGDPGFTQYSGDSLTDECQPDAYFNTDSYDVRIEKCKLRTLRSGIKALIIRGVSADKYDWWDEVHHELQAVEISQASRQYLQFKLAFLQLKSAPKPGLIISSAENDAHIADDARNLDFNSVEKIFDKIIDSLTYIK